MEDLQDGKLDNLIRSLAKFSQNVAVISAAEYLFADWSREYGPALILNRLIIPTSKLGVNDWKDTVYRPQFDSLQLHHFYRAIDFLDENRDIIEEQLYYRHTDLFSGHLDLVFFDTTSTYVEGDAGAFDLLDYGHSKDHRPDRLQVMIGVLMSWDGIPIAHHVFPGNTPDTGAFMEK